MVTLPQELQHLMFDMHLLDWPGEIVKIMLLCKRTHQWLAADLYRVVDLLSNCHFNSPQSGKHYDEPSHSYYGRFVRHALVGGDMSTKTISDRLSAFQNMIHLALWSPHPITEFIPLLRPGRLQLLSAQITTLTAQDFKAPAFWQLTHLDVTDYRSQWKHYRELRHLPALSHLALTNTLSFGSPFKKEHIQTLLEICKGLKGLIIISDYGVPGTYYNKLPRSPTYDDRVVFFYIKRFQKEEWIDGARGKPYFWTSAQDIIRGRFAKSISYEDSFKWIDEKEFRQNGVLWRPVDDDIGCDRPVGS